MTALRQVLIVHQGGVHAEVVVDNRLLVWPEQERYRGWTCTDRELRLLASDFGPCIVVEVVHHPERRTLEGRRTRREQTCCRVLFTIPVPSTDAADAA